MPRPDDPHTNRSIIAPKSIAKRWGCCDTPIPAIHNGTFYCMSCDTDHNTIPARDRNKVRR